MSDDKEMEDTEDSLGVSEDEEMDLDEVDGDLMSWTKRMQLLRKCRRQVLIWLLAREIFPCPSLTGVRMTLATTRFVNLNFARSMATCCLSLTEEITGY